MEQVQTIVSYETLKYKFWHLLPGQAIYIINKSIETEVFNNVWYLINTVYMYYKIISLNRILKSSHRMFFYIYLGAAN